MRVLDYRAETLARSVAFPITMALDISILPRFPGVRQSQLHLQHPDHEKRATGIVERSWLREQNLLMRIKPLELQYSF